MREIKVSPFERVALIEVSNKSYRKLYIMIQGTPTGGKETEDAVQYQKLRKAYTIKAYNGYTISRLSTTLGILSSFVLNTKGIQAKITSRRIEVRVFA